MKMVLITYNEAIDDEVTELLRSCGQTEYTKWTKVAGRGKRSDPHLMTPVWPKANNVLMACVDDAKSARVLNEIRNLRTTLGHAGVKAFSLPVEEMT